MLVSFVKAQQTTTVSGRVMEKGKDVSIPFADVIFKGTTIGTITDENGYFTLTTTKKVNSIRVSFLGYKSKEVPIQYGKKEEIIIELEEEGIELQTIEIRYTGNPAEMLLDSARKYRKKNDMKRLESYETEAYVKTQFNLYRITEKFKNQKLLKPFKFIFDNPDTINGELQYPFLISETLSDIYKKHGTEAKELIKAANISGIENDNFFSLLGSVYTDFNFYDDNQLVLGKNFISPLNPVALSFYKVYLVDTAFIDNNYCYKIELVPRLPNEQIYVGHLWIHDTTYAIKELHFKMNPKANINIMADFEFKVKFKQLDNKYWVIDKEEGRVDLDPRDFIDFTFNLAPKSEKFRITIIKKSSFKKYKINQPPSEIFKKLPDDVTITDTIRKSEEFWEKHRHDSLSNTEKRIYSNVDSIKKIPFFKFLYKIGDLVGSGYLDFGWVGIGPVYEMYSFNGLEGHRIRIGGRTGNKVSKRFILEGHITYGTKDNRWKWDLYSTYHFNKSKNPWRMIGLKAQMDVEQLGLSSTQWRADNFLGTFLRRRSLNDLSYVNKINIFYEHDWFSGLNNRISFTWFEIYQTPTLPFNRVSTDNQGNLNYDKFIKTEFQFETTFSYGQKFLVGRNKRRVVRGRYPTIKLIYAVSIKDLLGSDFTYHNLKISIFDKIRIKPFGTGFYELAAGKIFGVVPFPFMEIHLGNDTYMADMINSFNIMNYFEFVSDQWISFKYQHYFDGFFINKIPGLRKTKLREFVGVKMLMGSISQKNKDFIKLPANTYELKDPVTQRHIPYIEVNAGIENIFNILYIQFNWRLTYRREADPNNPGMLLFPQAINWGIQGGVFLQL